MAYTVPNRLLIRPWSTKGRRRYGIVKSSMLVGTTTQQVATGGGVTAGTTALADQVTPVAPCRIVGIQYGKRTAAETYAAATGGALFAKAESQAGVQIWTDADISSVQDGFQPVGTTAIDEANGATAATDGFSGGFPIRGGIYNNITGGTDGERIEVEYLVRYCTYARIPVIATSGADGTGAGSYTLDLGGPGTVAAVGVDYQNTPATADLTITADDPTTGTALLTVTNTNTDIPPRLLGRPGSDEAKGASAATDGTESANAFKKSLTIAVAQSDIYTSSNEVIVVELWIDD